MNKQRLLATLALAGALTLPALGHAVEFNAVQADKSAITFAYKQMGVGMEGHFKKFSAQLAFDPAKPTAAKAVLDVDLASIDTGSAEANDEVAGKQWFNTKAYPTAHFASSSVKALGGNRYEVAGQLTIKGRTQTVTAPTTVTVQGKAASFDGTFTLKRADFAIGEGPWADFGTVANEIQIKFHVLANGK
ncbi:YceI family protein [Denitratisoma sp. agr-D3]